MKYILLCNSFVFSCIESIFGMEVLWDNRLQPHTSLLWKLGSHGNQSDASISLLSHLYWIESIFGMEVLWEDKH